MWFSRKAVKLFATISILRKVEIFNDLKIAPIVSMGKF